MSVQSRSVQNNDDGGDGGGGGGGGARITIGAGAAGPPA